MASNGAFTFLENHSVANNNIDNTAKSFKLNQLDNRGPFQNIFKCSIKESKQDHLEEEKSPRLNIDHFDEKIPEEGIELNTKEHKGPKNTEAIDIGIVIPEEESETFSIPIMNI